MRRASAGLPARLRTGPCAFAALLLALAPQTASAGLKRTEARAVAATCGSLAADAAAAAKAGDKPALVFDATVGRTETDGATVLTFLCAAPGPIVVCTEYRKPSPPAGSRVRVHGIVSGTWDKGLVLDPCDTAPAD